jgi:uncharacterized membrane protein YfcA
MGGVPVPSPRHNAGARLVLVGVAAGLFGGLLGVGGGMVLVPGLLWAAGVDRHTATGTSLLAMLPIAVVATAAYAVGLGDALDVRASAAVVLGSLAGAALGARWNASTSERGLRIAFALFTIAVGVRLIVPPGFGPGSELELGPATVALLAALGLAGGVLSGLLGVGGGLIVIVVMVSALDTSQVLAQGVAMAAVIPTTVVGALAHRRLGSLAPRAALHLGLVGAAASVPGVLAAFALPVDVLRTVFGAFLILNAARTLHAVLAGDRPAAAEG